MNALEEKINVSNQTLRAAVDRFQEARDVLRETRSALVSARHGQRIAVPKPRSRKNKALFGGTSPVNYSDLMLEGDVSYEADAWGAVRRSVEASRTLAQASAADLETIRLSLHAELALDYLTLRGLDAQKQLFDTNVDAFEKALQLTESRFQGGVASREDVDLAATQLEQTRAEDIDITSARDQFEHAVAVLIGQPASSFSLDPAPLPATPAGASSRTAVRIAGKAARYCRGGKKSRLRQRTNWNRPGGIFPDNYLGARGRIRERAISKLADGAERALVHRRDRGGNCFRCRDAGARFPIRPSRRTTN